MLNWLNAGLGGLFKASGHAISGSFEILRFAIILFPLIFYSYFLAKFVLYFLKVYPPCLRSLSPFERICAVALKCNARNIILIHKAQSHYTKCNSQCTKLNFLLLIYNSCVCHSVRRAEWRHLSELEIPWNYWAEDLNCFSSLGLEIIVQVLRLKIYFDTISLFIHTLITNTLIHCANTRIDSEKSFMSLQFDLDRVFKYPEFVPILGFASDENEFFVLESLV